MGLFLRQEHWQQFCVVVVGLCFQSINLNIANNLDIFYMSGISFNE